MAELGPTQDFQNMCWDYVSSKKYCRTSRLADEVAKRTRREDIWSISFAKIIDELRKQSSRDRLHQYYLRISRVGVRIPIAGKLPPHIRIEEHVKIIASIEYDQFALENPFNSARIQNRTLTSRQADEVAKRIRRGDIWSIRSVSKTQMLLTNDWVQMYKNDAAKS